MNLLTRRTPEQVEPKNPRNSGIPPLTRWEQGGAAVTALGGVAVGGLGFYASFGSVSAKAAEWGFTDPWVLPAAIDTAIPVFTVAGLFLIRMGMPLWWARLVPWVLSLITCALNVAAGNSLWSKVAHGSMALLWVAVSEIAAHIYAARIGAATGRRRQMDKVRWARWFLAPTTTFMLWRRMKLWELTSYDEALGLEQKRLAYEALLRSRFGRSWKRKAPVEALMPLRLARVGVPLDESIPAGLQAVGIEPTGIFAPPIAPVEETPSLPAPVPVTAAIVPAVVHKPRPVTATVPAQKLEAPEPAPDLEQDAPEPAPEPVQDASATGQASPPIAIPEWHTEDELYEIIKWVLDNGYRDVFSGPLTGAEIANVLDQSEGNGRKVRGRLIKTYAAERDVDLPPRANVDQVFAAFGHAMTPLGA